MAGKKLIAMFAAFALAAGLAAARAEAGCSPIKNGPKGCKNEVKACITTEGCANLGTKKEKKTCKRTCKTSIVSACKQQGGSTNTICSGSPSGSFLD